MSLTQRNAELGRLLRRRTGASYLAAAAFAASGVLVAIGPLGANPLAGLILATGSLAPLYLGLVLSTRQVSSGARRGSP